MQVSFPPSLLSLLLLLSLVSTLLLGLALPDWSVVLAQGNPCPGIDQNYVLFDRGSTVYIELDYRFDETQRTNIIAGFESWNYANSKFEYLRRPLRHHHTAVSPTGNLQSD